MFTQNQVVKGEIGKVTVLKGVHGGRVRIHVKAGMVDIQIDNKGAWTTVPLEQFQEALKEEEV